MDILSIRKQMSDNKTKLADKMNASNEQSYKDERFWSLDFDKTTKRGKAIIRPIGPALGESDEYVTEYTHFLRRNGKILSIKCPTSNHGKCPICQYFFSKDKEERDKQFARATKHIMNILVVNDFQHPENNGKVFLYRCPVVIMNKIAEAIKDKDQMDMPKESINVFDMWEGANINLVTTDKGGWINYDSSSIAQKSPIFEDTENSALYEELYKKLYPLAEFKETPTFEDVKEKFDNFMSLVDTNTTANSVKKQQDEVLDKIETVIQDEIPEKFNTNTSSKSDDFTSMSEDDMWNEL